MPQSAQHSDPEVMMREIVTQYETYGDIGQNTRIWAAYDYAKKSHEGVMRKSGDPYISHPVAAACELIVLQPDSTTLITTLLHDAVSHGAGSYTEIGTLFGEDVKRMVEHLDTIRRVKYRGESSHVARMQKMLLVVADDIRTLLVKMAERVHNLKTIQYHNDPEKVRHIAEESLFIYAPIAARLGLYSFKDSLETLSFRALDLNAYLKITGELAHYTAEQEDFLTQSIQKLKAIVPSEFHEAITYRIKKPYSMYRKMQERASESIFDMYDIFAIRILTKNIADCYAVLGYIHGAFAPVPGRIKDFIAVPKLNGYKSLHTTVLGLANNKNQPIEIQIRTEEMDYHAEHGVAAHVLYKQFGDATHTKQSLQDVLSTLADGLLEVSEPVLGTKVRPTIFVLTPKGDIRELPHGATPVDFAYSVHSDVGYHTIGARINGTLVTLDTPLKNGDMVEVITQHQAHPSAQWLDFVVSSKARAEIGVEIKRLSGDRDRAVKKGREMVLQAFSDKGINLDPECRDLRKYVDFTLDTKKLEELLYQVGQGIRKTSSLLPYTKPVKTSPLHNPKISSHSSTEKTLIIGGERHVPHTLAQCCNPHFPEEVVAVMRSGGKCMVHAQSCRSLQRVNPARLLSAYWSTQETGVVVPLIIVIHDRPGFLADVTKSLYHAGVNIVDIHTKPVEDGAFEITIRMEIPSNEGDFLERLKMRLQISVPSIIAFH